MKDFFTKCIAWTISIISVVFLFFTDDIFSSVLLFPKLSSTLNVFILKLLFCIATMILVCIARGVFLKLRSKVIIRGSNYNIEVRFGNIFSISDSKRIIPFDECFTTTVGDRPGDINPGSVCGQYLKNKSVDIAKLVSESGIEPKGKSKFKGKERYESGRIIPNGDDFLLAFAKLDKDGLGFMSFDDYKYCLEVMWGEIDKYYGQRDVCMPIIGSGVTRFKDATLNKQELLDVIIASYRLNRRKIHKPNKLIIVCPKGDISLNKIGDYM